MVANGTTAPAPTLAIQNVIHSNKDLSLFSKLNLYAITNKTALAAYKTTVPHIDGDEEENLFIPPRLACFSET